MSTPEEIKGLKKLIVYTCQYYNQEITDGALELQLSDLRGLDFASVYQAFGKYRLDRKNRRAPLPADIINLISPTLENVDEARLISGRIWEAISKFGAYSANQARAHLGETAWQVVTLMGGWVSICATPLDDRGIFMAQARDMAHAVVVEGASHNNAPQLDGPATPEVRQLANSAFGSMPNTD